MRPYTVNQIQNFLEVAWQKPVSESADRSFVTQAADSMQIRQVKRAFGHAMRRCCGCVAAQMVCMLEGGPIQSNTSKCTRNLPELLSLFLAMQTNCIQAGAKSLARIYATK